jgi:hypothetical protein
MLAETSRLKQTRHVESLEAREALIGTAPSDLDFTQFEPAHMPGAV